MEERLEESMEDNMEESILNQEEEPKPEVMDITTALKHARYFASYFDSFQRIHEVLNVAALQQQNFRAVEEEIAMREENLLSLQRNQTHGEEELSKLSKSVVELRETAKGLQGEITDAEAGLNAITRDQEVRARAIDAELERIRADGMRKIENELGQQVKQLIADQNRLERDIENRAQKLIRMNQTIAQVEALSSLSAQISEMVSDEDVEGF